MQKTAISLLTASMLLVACGDDSQQSSGDNFSNLGGETLATVDGQPVSDQLLNAFIRQYPNVDPESIPAEQREQLRDHMISLTVLTQEAERRNIHREDETRAALALERMQTLADRLIREIEEEQPISDEEIQALYDERFAAVREYRARHILVDEEEQARDLLSQIQNGADFAELAQEHSKDGSAANGGDLDWFNPDQMVPPFAEAVRGMEAGEVSGEPVETRFGWHLIKLEDTREGDAPSMEEVRDDLVNAIRQEKVQAFISELREKADVQE